MAIIRFKSNTEEKLLNDSEFLKLMIMRPGSPEWKEIDTIQGCILNKRGGLAESIVFKYYAPLNMSKPQTGIEYSIKSMESDEALKQSGNSNRYALKICTIIGYYLAKIYQIVFSFFALSFLGASLYDRHIFER